MHRRFVLKLLAALYLMPATAVRAGSAPKLFASYIDTLLPADELSPSGSALGVDRAVLAEVRGSASLRALYLDGLRWLQRTANSEHGRPFHELDEAARVATVVLAEQAAPDSTAHRFFIHSRDAAMEKYYARPESWTSLGELHPPQPLGYPEYHRRPDS